MGFELVEGLLGKRIVLPFGIVIGHVVVDLERGFGQPREAAAVEEFGFKVAPTRFGMRVIVGQVAV